jgi:hypothetical protein
MPIVPRAATFTHLRHAFRSTSTYVVIGDNSAAGVILGLAVALVPFALDSGQVHFGRFAYAFSPDDPDPTPVYYVTFSGHRVARDTIGDLLALHGVLLGPRLPSNHAAEVIPLSDDLPRLLSVVSRVVADPGAVNSYRVSIAPQRASYASPAPLAV